MICQLFFYELPKGFAKEEKGENTAEKPKNFRGRVGKNCPFSFFMVK